MTKTEIVKNASKDLGIEAMDIRFIFDTIIKEIKGSLERGEGVKVQGLGSFKIKESKPTKKFNMNTGEVEEIPSKKHVFFTASQEIINNMNK